MSVASKTTSKGNLSKAPSTSQIGSKTELKAAENAPAQQKAEAALPTPPPDIDPEILKTMIVIPGLTFITRDEREKMLLEPSVDE